MNIRGIISTHMPMLWHNNSDDSALPVRSDASGLNNITGTEHPQSCMDLSRFTTWGNGFSFGRLIGGAMRLPGSGLCMLGDCVEASEWSIVRRLGSNARFLGKVLGTIGGLNGQAVTLGERLVINNLKGLGAGALTATGVVARSFGNTSLLESGIALIKDAWMTRGESQEVLSEDKKRQVTPFAYAIENLYFKKYVKGSFDLPDFFRRFLPRHMLTLPDGFTAIKIDDIPESWKNRCDPISSAQDGLVMVHGFSVPVSLSRGPDDEIIVAFGGVSNIESLGSVILGACGVADRTFLMARDFVRDLASKHPGKVHVIGHSLGGALAQFAGIKANVSVTCFNAMGLPAQLTDELVDLTELGQGKLTKQRVEHINSGDDWLAQKLQTRYLPFGLSQLGKRYKDEEARGHLINAFR